MSTQSESASLSIQSNSRAASNTLCYRPRTKCEGKVIFSLCLSVPRGRSRTPISGSRSLLCLWYQFRSGEYPCLWYPVLSWGRGYPSQVLGQGTPLHLQLPSPRQYTSWTEYAVGRTPLACPKFITDIHFQNVDLLFNRFSF